MLTTWLALVRLGWSLRCAHPSDGQPKGQEPRVLGP